MAEQQGDDTNVSGDSRPSEYRCGTVVLVGRPNVGKSTLMNQLLREKVAIVSNKPQTTRHRLIGILSEPNGQMVFWDTPGVHKPLHQMNRRMVQAAVDAVRDSDLVCLIADVSASFGRGDQFLLDLVAQTKKRRIAVLNKVDKVKKPKILPVIERYHATGLFEEIVPISALTGENSEVILDLLWQRLPISEPLFDPELVTVHTERFLVGERIREKVLEQTREEVPFSSAVMVEDWRDEELSDGRTRLHLTATILVERASQKKIVVGAGGQKIKSIGIAARLDLERFLERPVYLDLQVRHEAKWRENAHVLRELDRGLVSFDLE